MQYAINNHVCHRLTLSTMPIIPTFEFFYSVTEGDMESQQ